MDRDPNHPVLPDAWQWEVVGFHWRGDPSNPARSLLDLTLWRDGNTRRLRFVRPQGVRIQDGFRMTHGLAILDIGGRGWQDAKVEVINFEFSDGSPEFLAADVFDLDDPGNELRKLETDV